MADQVRPSTGSSGRTAWDEKVNVYDDAEGGGGDAPVPWNEGGEQPTAMESEVFDQDGAVRVQQRQREREKPQGCWQRFTSGIRGIWMTKHTEDTEYDRELFIRTTLRELVVYVIFLIVLCIVTFGMTNSTQYYYTKVMSELFLDGGEKPFREISNMDDFWEFADKGLLPGLHHEQWYNGDPVSDDQRNFIYFENKILGLPRLRQLRVRNDSCEVPDSFKREIKECFNSYSKGNEDRKPFGPQNGTAWVYRTEKELGGGSYWGLVGTYPGGGFVQDLGSSKLESGALIAELKNHKWITRGTRAISIDFTVYNANINLFSVIRLFLEFPATGGVIPSFSFRTVKLLRYVTAFDIFVLVCEGIFCAFILYYIIEEIIEIAKHRCSYFKNFWNILDVLVIGLALACIGFSVYRQIMVNTKLDDLLRNERQYANFEFLSFAQTRFNDCVAIMIFFAWVKIFKYISFNKTMNQLSSTLSRCAKDVGGFAIMFFIFFLAYAQLGYLIFGTQVKDFSTFYDAVFTLLRTILGDFDFHELEQANRILGPLFFITYVFFVFFVLLNMFLAIINDTYAEVKAELATQKNEFELGDYFKRGYYNMLRKMNIRKDKLVDIQAAIGGADSNGDKQVDFDEWRSHLKQRGYSEAEIEGMFAKYDMDGDRTLSVEEQNNMSAELGGERRFLDDQMSEARSMGPPSARSGFADFDGMGPRGGRGGIGLDDYNVLNRRVDRMEQSIGSVVAKIDATLSKLEAMEKVKARHRDKIAAIIADAGNSNAEPGVKVEKMQEGLKSELDRFENDADTN